MPRKRQASDQRVEPVLRVPRVEAEEKLRTRIDKGEELFSRLIRTPKELERARSDYYKWSDYNRELLLRLFTNSSLADEYTGSGAAFAIDRDFYEEIGVFRRDVQSNIRRIESILERLELIPSTPEAGQSAARMDSVPSANEKVFIVHGHDEQVREAVARFVERLGLTAIILHEQPNAGRTIIEKFEGHANVGFAVILLTPDDVCAAKSDVEHPKVRARQNVIFELGFFFARLGRDRVCALYSEGVELPSDIQGMVYIPLDSNGGWHLRLAKELRHAGLTIDLNKAL